MLDHGCTDGLKIVYIEILELIFVNFSGDFDNLFCNCVSLIEVNRINLMLKNPKKNMLYYVLSLQMSSHEGL